MLSLEKQIGTRSTQKSFSPRLNQKHFRFRIALKTVQPGSIGFNNFTCKATVPFLILSVPTVMITSANHNGSRSRSTLNIIVFPSRHLLHFCAIIENIYRITPIDDMIRRFNRKSITPLCTMAKSEKYIFIDFFAL